MSEFTCAKEHIRTVTYATWATIGEHAATGPLPITGKKEGWPAAGGQLVCPNPGRASLNVNPGDSNPKPSAPSFIPSRIWELDNLPAPLLPRLKENLAWVSQPPQAHEQQWDGDCAAGKSPTLCTLSR